MVKFQGNWYYDGLNIQNSFLKCIILSMRFGEILKKKCEGEVTHGAFENNIICVEKPHPYSECF